MWYIVYEHYILLFCDEVSRHQFHMPHIYTLAHLLTRANITTLQMKLLLMPTNPTIHSILSFYFKSSVPLKTSSSSLADALNIASKMGYIAYYIISEPKTQKKMFISIIISIMTLLHIYLGLYNIIFIP